MIDQGIFTLISADSGLTNIVGSRIYPVISLVNPVVYPYLSYHSIKVAGTTEYLRRYTLDGAQTGEKRMQFDAWAQSYAEAQSILNALRNVLDTTSGILADGTWLLGAFRGEPFDAYESSTRVF